MQLVAVTPRKQPWLASSAGHLLVQASWIKEDAAYKSFVVGAIKAGIKVTLDYIHPSRTQAITAMPVSEYVELAYELAPFEVVVPDAFKDVAFSMARAASFMELWSNIDWVAHPEKHVPQLMFVPQGTNVDEYLSCAMRLQSTYSPDVFGVPKWLAQANQRNTAEAALRFIAPDAILHRLGVWRGPEELFEPVPEGVAKKLRSWDMAMPFGFAQASKDVSDPAFVSVKHSYHPEATMMPNLAVNNLLWCMSKVRALGNGNA